MNLNVNCLLFVIPLFLLPIVLKSIRWKKILEIQGIELPASRALLYYVASLFWGIITPGRIGEGVKVLYLRKQGISTGRSALSIILDRLFDLGALLLLDGIGVFIFFGLRWSLISLSIVGIVCWVLWKIREKTPWSGMLSWLFSLLPERLKGDLSQLGKQFRTDMEKFSSPNIMLLGIFSVLIWFLYASPFLLFGEAVGIEISPFFLIMGIFCSALVAMLPISIGGVGTREAFFIYYLGKFGIPKEESLLFSFMFIYLHIFALVLGLCALLVKRQINP